RFVVHDQMPGSIDAYYQETGRAGRDGGAADCILLFDLNDRRVQQFLQLGRYPERELVERVREALGKHDDGARRASARPNSRARSRTSGATSSWSR
ncbi:hypothetical protein BZM27_34510, partial [Paraburkholderia steynii]